MPRLDKLFFGVFTAYLSSARGRPGRCGQQKDLRLQIARTQLLEEQRMLNCGETSIDRLSSSKLPIFKWLPANRAPISFSAAGSDKNAGYCDWIVLESMMGTPRRVGSRVRGGYPEKVAARWQRIAGATRSLAEPAGRSATEGKATITLLLIHGSTAIYMIVIGVLLLKPSPLSIRSRLCKFSPFVGRLLG